MLKFDGNWRFDSPGQIERAVAWSFRELIDRICAQGHSWEVLEHFKVYFSGAAGRHPCYQSSDEGWASTDLDNLMSAAAENAPLFIEAFHDACEGIKSLYPDVEVPGVGRINRILGDEDSGFQIDLPNLVATREYVPIAVPAQAPSLDAQAKALIEEALLASDRALSESNGRQAVQELLWLLETISTAFRSPEILDGSIHGQYFNKIIGELRRRRHGHQTQILKWLMSLHGYLSSPTGGGIRHGVDLKEGLELSLNEARLYCNLSRSYLTFLVSEHERLTREGL